MTTGHNMFFISLQFGTWHHNCQAGQPPCVPSILNLLNVQSLMLCRFSCLELFKFPNSALHSSNVGVSAHCMLSATLFIWYAMSTH